MKIKPGQTYLYQGKTVTVLADLDTKTFLVTTGKVLSVQKKELHERAK